MLLPEDLGPKVALVTPSSHPSLFQPLYYKGTGLRPHIGEVKSRGNVKKRLELPE